MIPASFLNVVKYKKHIQYHSMLEQISVLIKIELFRLA